MGEAGSRGTLDVELDADGRRVDISSAPVKSIGSTWLVGIGAGGADVKVDGALAGLDGTDVKVI